MEIKIQPYTEEWIPGVKEFNRRMVTAGLEEELCFPESHVPQYPKTDGAVIYQEFYLAIEGSFVRGAYCLTHEPWSFFGERQWVAHYRLPMSEVVVNRVYKGVGSILRQNAMERQPLLYCIGMGGFDRPVARSLKTGGWSLASVPFFFKVHHPHRFLRRIAFLRKSMVRRMVLDLAAFTGVGWVGIKALQGVRGIGGKRNRVVSGEVVPEFSVWADELWEKCRKRYRLAAVRDSRTLNLRYPAGDSRFIRLRISDDKGVLGWALLLNTAMQRNKYFGDLRVGSLVDCLAVPEDASAVVASATDFLRSGGADLTVSNQSHHAWCGALRGAGFLEGPSNYVFAVSPPYSTLIEPFDTHKREFHLNRGDGAGPIRL